MKEDSKGGDRPLYSPQEAPSTKEDNKDEDQPLNSPPEPVSMKAESPPVASAPVASPPAEGPWTRMANPEERRGRPGHLGSTDKWCRRRRRLGRSGRRGCRGCRAVVGCVVNAFLYFPSPGWIIMYKGSVDDYFYYGRCCWKRVGDVEIRGRGCNER